MFKKTLYALVVLSLLSSIAVGVYARPLQNEEPKGGLFHSYLSIEVSDTDIDKLSKPLPLFTATPIQLKISYWHDIPIKLGMLTNMLIFHTPVPQQIIHLEIEKKPDWATIYFSESDVIVDVPNKDEKEVKNVTLTISPLREAPSEPTDITIVATCGKLGLLGGAKYRYTISFTPNFIASIAVEAPAKIDISPHQTKEIEIKVKNLCNRNVMVKAEPIGEAKTRWGASVQPSFVEIPVGQTAVFHFSIVGPYDLGWHEEIKTLTVQLEVTPKPELTSEQVEPQKFNVDITVQNVGFYMPIPLLAAIIVVIAIVIAVIAVIMKIGVRRE
ncbi:MAG: hypothetical protein DRN25_06455 [Thermoplasmata archaeon]|nr:MAG: hypothetical protein DRN25_06455 [Thermoplasmata archaeon]